MKHWAAKYIGTPWEMGATGPDKFDCWGFVRHVQREHFGRDLLEAEYGKSWKSSADEIQNNPERANWEKTETPHEGDLVLMARNKHPVHIGLWIKANGTEGVLHCQQGIGVAFLSKRELPLSGWGNFQFLVRKE